MSRHHHKKKSRHQYDVIDDRPMLASEEADNLEAAANDELDVDSDYDEHVNRILDEAKEELFKETNRAPVRKFKSPPPDDADDAKPNYWYQDMCKKKIRETKERLEDLSKLACYTCDSIAVHIKRMEQDHGTTFCKMDYSVRHPPLNRPWTNTWKFECTIKCIKTGEPSHTHTAYCQSVVLEHQNISEIDCPEYIRDAVQLFEDFAFEANRDGPMTDTKESLNIEYLKTMWTGIKVNLRSNCQNELMMIIRGKKINSQLVYKLRKFFKRAPEADTNIVSVFCLNQVWHPKKNKSEPELVTGWYQLEDRVGPLSIEYRPKTSIDFNAVEATQLGKIIKEYAGLTQETTLLDIGCNFGVLSLMMSFECEAVFGINTMHSLNNEIPQAEELKKFNKIHNTTFVTCNPDDLLTRCSTFIQKCITVAVLNLTTPFGKNKNVVQALRNLPSIWRVIVYGPYTKEFHRNINTLITENHALGERFLPMQGCILDKSSSDEKAFDIIIMFERQSLITPKIELLAPGPTLNIKIDYDAYEYGLDVKDIKPKREDRYQQSRSSKEESEEERPSCSTDARRSDYSRDDERSRRDRDRSSHSSRSREHRTEHSRRSRDDRSSREERSHSTNGHRSSSTSFKDRQMLRDERIDSPPLRSHEKHTHQSRDRHPRVSPTPPLPIPREESPPSTSKFRPSFTPVREKSPVEKTRQEPRDKQPLLSVKKEFNCPSPQRERAPSPPLFPSIEETDFLEEDCVTYPPSRTQTPESRPNSVSNATDDGVFKVPIKPEPANLQSPIIANLKNEPEDMDISPDPPDFQSMETPIHNPRAFTHPPPPPPATKVTINEFEFPLQANLSYLPKVNHDEENDLPDVSKIKKEKDAGDETLTTGEVADEALEMKKEKDAGDETLTTGETVDDAPKIKKEKDAGNETLTAGEVVEETPKAKREKITGDETLTSGVTADGTTEIKKEKDAGDKTLASEETAKDENATVKIKTEIVDPGYSAYESSKEVNFENIPLPVIIKSEPVESPEIPLVKVKNEPVDMEISPNPRDIESMETPMHNPRAFDKSSPASPPINGLDFSVQPNLSYLPVKREPEPVVPSVNVKAEPDDEIAIIGEKKSEPKKKQPKIRVKTVDEIIKVKTEMKEQEDLRTLYEKRQAILRKLGEEEKDQSETELPQAYKRPSSRSPIRKFKRSPDSSPRKYSRSPSPYHKRKRSRRPSPERRRRRSPSSPIRFKKEPLSPSSDRRRERKRRSPSLDIKGIYGTTSSRDKRSRRSRSRSPRRR